MKKCKYLPFLIMFLFINNAISADNFIGHAYSFKCPYYGCDDVDIYARPLFKKNHNDWQIFPQSKDIGNTLDALQLSYKLFPVAIKWNIFNYDQSLIGEELVENNRPSEWWMNVGASKMQFDLKKIIKYSDIIGYYDPMADLILSTNKSSVFYKYKTRETTDVKIFESSINYTKDIVSNADTILSIEKSATIYSIENMDVIAILDFKQISDEMVDVDSVVLIKTGDKWEFAFDGQSTINDRDNVFFRLKTIADFDNDGKSEYIFILSSGINRFGYILWHDGITKPLVYEYSLH